MKKNIYYAALFVVVASGVYGYRIWDAFRPSELSHKYDAATVPAIHQIEFFSHEIDQNYMLYVQVPHGYEESEKRYPVFYQIDGRTAAGLYRDTVLPLLREGKMPEAIFVSVDSIQSRGETMFINPARRRDWTFRTMEDGIPSGGGATFLAFLWDRVGPFIDAAYRTIPEDRGIGGYQMSALFCLTVLLTEPESFSRYIVLDPSLSWDNMIINEFEERYAKDHERLNAQVYLGTVGFGSEFRQRHWRAMADTLHSRRYEGLLLMDDLVSGETPLEAIQAAVSSGLEYVYRAVE